MSLSAWVEAQIAALRREGRHADAARLCVQRGAFAEASRLYAEVWEWTEAIEAAERAGLFGEVYRHAVAARRPVDAERALAALLADPAEAARFAPEAERMGRLADAARLHRAAGDLEEAARCFEAAGEPFEAGLCLEASGRYRDAGRAYESQLKLDPDAHEAALRLGRILARMGRYDQAARALQIAARGPARLEAERWLIGCFEALDMTEAAAARLEALRRTHPGEPLSVPELLDASFGDRRGLLTFADPATEATLLAGRYRVVRTIGQGATGRVLEAEDTFHGRRVAVKVLTVGGGTAGRDAFARFAREARVAASLAHPNVIAVYDYVAAGPFLVMERMTGGTLEDRLRAAEAEGRPLPLPRVRHIAEAILAGLEAVHRRGVVHRDLKPANIFFGPTQDVKLGDFGTAHLADLGATLTGAFLGTLAYMAPEQITGAIPPSAATDAYAFGVILFRMLAGRLPFPGPDFVSQHLEQAPPRLAELRPELGDTFDPLLASLLEKDPSRRARQAAELWAALATLPFEALERGSPDGWLTPARVITPSSAPPVEAEALATRYTLVEVLPGGARRMHDRLLDRPVLAIEVNDADRAFYQAAARADGPFLQAVYGLADGLVFLEDPRGASIDQLSAEALRPHATSLRGALAALHREGIAHGAIGPATVRLCETRALLLLPARPGDDPEEDRRALEALLEGAR